MTATVTVARSCPHDRSVTPTDARCLPKGCQHLRGRVSRIGDVTIDETATGVVLRVVSWDHPDAEELRAAQRADIVTRPPAFASNVSWRQPNE